MRREKGRRERFVLLSDLERALRRKMLTVVAPEVRVPALRKESGFAVMVFSRARVAREAAGARSKAENATGASRQEGKAYQKIGVRG
jgi:hypothetical protein